MEGAERAGKRRKAGSHRFGIAAMAVVAGLVFAPLPGVAWADPAVGGSTSSETAHAGPAHRSESTTPARHRDGTKGSGKDGRDEPAETDVHAADPGTGTGTGTGTGISTDTGDAGVDTSAPAAPPTEADTPEPVAAEPDSTTARDDVAAGAERGRVRHVVDRPVVAFGRAAHLHDDAPVATLDPAVGLLTMDAPSARPVVAEPTVAAPPDIATPTPVTVAGSTAVEPTTPTTPEPLSPVAELLQLPGRLINAVLQAFDITSTANGPHSPVNIAPINDLLFAAFRELERGFGLDRPPAVQPVVPTLTYTGSTTTPTPTVAQFLNASTAAYGLGTTPGGLVPFTVNGFQVKSVNIFTGFAAKTWVTPDGQVIIAYSGTTGGTNLLFNPLIAVTQIMTDLQVIFTNTTPWAFYNAVHFARRVQAAAAQQGYGVDDIFVTGHSLGGWEAQYVAQQIGLAGIGFESPGMNTTVPGNGAGSLFVNVETYGDAAPFMSTDLPGLQPFMPPYVPGGGSKPHYGSIVMIGDPAAMNPLINASALWRTGLIHNIIFLVDFLGNFFQYHLPGVQAYHLDVIPDPGVVPWMGTARGPMNAGWGDLTIPQLLKAASDAGTLFQP